MKFFNSKLSIILLIILALVAVYFIFYKEKNSPVVIDKSMEVIKDKIYILGNKDDLISFSVMPFSKVHGILSYKGVIKGGYFFEANILINILGSDKKVLKQSNAVATTDWMTAEPVSFEGNIDFTGLTKGPAYLEIHNDNASGIAKNDKSILIPIIIE